MLYFVIAVLLLVVILFGVSSGMQSYASAQQAKAQIETAQLGQINAWGNLVVLTVVLLIVLFVALAAAVLWTRSLKKNAQRSPLNQKQSIDPLPGSTAPLSMEMLIQLETLRMLRSMNPPASLPSGNHEHSQDDEPLQWLR